VDAASCCSFVSFVFVVVVVVVVVVLLIACNMLPSFVIAVVAANSRVLRSCRSSRLCLSLFCFWAKNDFKQVRIRDVVVDVDDVQGAFPIRLCVYVCMRVLVCVCARLYLHMQNI